MNAQKDGSDPEEDKSYSEDVYIESKVSNLFSIINLLNRIPTITKSCSTTPPLLIQAHISRSIFLSIHSFSSAVPISSILKVVTAYGLIVVTMIVIPACYTVLSHCRRHSVVYFSFLGLAHRTQPGLIALHPISVECSDSPAPSSTTSTTLPTRRPR